MTHAAEQALIARLLVDPSPIATLHLSPDDFGNRQYGKAFRAMQSLVGKGRPVDLVTLGAEGVVGLDDVLDAVTPAHRADVAEYATIIRRDSFRRRFINGLNDLVAGAEEGQTPEALVKALREEAAALAEGVESGDDLGRLNLSDYRKQPDPPYLGVLAPQGTTILYGEGGDGKGWVAAKLIAELHVRVAIIDFEMQTQEWGYRLDKFGASLDDVLYFSPATTFDKWATEEAAQHLRDAGVEMLVIDSAMYASDVDDPYSPNGALAYGRARRRLNNLPALLLAHTTGGQDKVFGSVFWKNECRISWRLHKDITRHRYLECKKANGYSWLEGTKYDIKFDEENGVLKLSGVHA